MAVTTSNIGTFGGIRITWDAGSILTDLIAAVEQFLLSHGWELHDATSTGSYARVYKSLQTGGTVGIAAHYSYIEVDFNTSNVLILRVWEIWDATAHTGTNKAINSYTATGASSNESQHAVTVNLTANGVLEIYSYGVIASGSLRARWVLFVSEVGGIRGHWVAAFERSRDIVGYDTLTRGIPGMIWSASKLVVQNRQWVWSIPRAFTTNNTGWNQEASNLNGIYVPEVYEYLFGNGGGNIPAQNNPISNLPAIGNFGLIILVASQNANWLVGRAYGPKIGGTNLGNDGDTINLPCDSNYFYNQSSANTVLHRIIWASTISGQVPIALPIG